MGDWFISDLAGGKVKAMRNSRREPIKQCGPGDVCEVMGSDALPAPGSEFFVCTQAASEAIREVRRLEYAYPQQDRFTKKSRQDRKDEEEVEGEEEVDAAPIPASTTGAAEGEQPEGGSSSVITEAVCAVFLRISPSR